MADPRLTDRLRHAAAPDAAGARARAREVVRAAGVAPSPRAPRRRGALLLVGALAAAALAAVAATPPGDAVARWVRDLVTSGPAMPAPRPVLSSLPGGGRLLVTGPGGVWVVRADGSRRRLGAYGDAAWSPHGLFVAVTRGRTLLAVEPGGVVHWALARPSAVHDPRWNETGYRIAYRTAGTLRVVAGDGSGDHLLATRATAVAPAWKPGRATELAVARAGHAELWMAGTPTRLGALPRTAMPVALAWTPDGRRLVVVARGGFSVFDARGRAIARQTVEGVTAAALSPDGKRLALVRGDTVLMTRLRSGAAQRTVYATPGRVASVTWSPDGRRLLVATPQADQWVFLPVRGTARVAVDGGIARQFDPARATPRGAPAVAGWCCSG